MAIANEYAICESKSKYARKEDADRAWVSMWHAGHVTDLKRFNVYRCRLGNHWHLGHIQESQYVRWMQQQKKRLKAVVEGTAMGRGC